MDISSYVLLSHEQALRRRLDVTANNMANTSTVGFKREQPVFHEFVEQSGDPSVPSATTTSYVLDYGAIHDTSMGAFQATGNPLDVMIDGPGYLQVEAPGGGTAYTRAGFVKVLPSGDLAAAGGQRLLDATGKPINIPPDQLATLSIASDGSVSGAQGVLGRIALTVFADEAGVTPRGDGLMAGSGGRILSAAETKLTTGGVEGSNVQPIVETTAMVEILRSYQSSQRLSQAMDDLRKNAIDRLGRFT
ncbi:flagellar basal-body rod protein FlgF [Novosphingobium sp. Rr 2-17]|uniref:flagellar hook basal-body protein n=1 Tax=Novosphingobium sp. Rr 2-17 TaxID=555793 RepID=UPI0002699545|nr:flagellar hook basal-body protein [Novosphingobium sp. Rr 2-17]EIZ78736.1 flagellar basal-body rod protein FlgF [Novosphingobium sp. Rr 2-17]